MLMFSGHFVLSSLFGEKCSFFCLPVLLLALIFFVPFWLEAVAVGFLIVLSVADRDLLRKRRSVCGVCWAG